MTEVLGPLLTVVEMIIIIVVVICTVILACGITIFLILIHKRRIIKPSYPKIDWHKVSVETNSAEINQKPINILGQLYVNFESYYLLCLKELWMYITIEM